MFLENRERICEQFTKVPGEYCMCADSAGTSGIIQTLN